MTGEKIAARYCQTKQTHERKPEILLQTQRSSEKKANLLFTPTKWENFEFVSIVDGVQFAEKVNIHNSWISIGCRSRMRMSMLKSKVFRDSSHCRTQIVFLFGEK